MLKFGSRKQLKRKLGLRSTTINKTKIEILQNFSAIKKKRRQKSRMAKIKCEGEIIKRERRETIYCCVIPRETHRYEFGPPVFYWEKIAGEVTFLFYYFRKFALRR